MPERVLEESVPKVRDVVAQWMVSGYLIVTEHVAVGEGAHPNKGESANYCSKGPNPYCH